MAVTQDNLKLAQFVGIDANDANTSMVYNVAGAVVKTVKNQRVDNVVNMDKSWDFYQGAHAKYFIQRRNEPTDVYNWRKTNIVKPNYCKFLINLQAKYAYGRNAKIRRQFTLEEAKSRTEDRLRRLDQIIGYQALMMKIKRFSGLFGEQTVRLCPVDENTGDLLTAKANQSTYPQPVLLDPRHTFVLKNQWGRITAVVVEDSYTDYVEGTKVATVELIVSDARFFFRDGKLTESSINQWDLNSEFVSFINNDLMKDDLQDVMDLQIKLNEALTDASHFYEFQSYPQMVAKLDLSDVVKSAGYIWEISGDLEGKIKDSIDYLTWDGAMADARKYQKDLEAHMFKIASTAPIATGDLEGIGQLRSGAALITANAPSIQKAQEAYVTWWRNEYNFFKALTTMDSFYHGQPVDTRFPKLNIDIHFPEDFVPGEDLIREEIHAMSMNAHTTTIRDVARSRHPEKTEEEITEYRKEIIEDSMDLTDKKHHFVSEKTGEETEEKLPVKDSVSKSNEQKKTKEK